MQNEYKKKEAQLLRLLRDAEDSARELGAFMKVIL